MSKFSLILILISCGLLGCSTAEQTRSSLSSASVLSDFRVMSTPRSEIPLGARWQQEIGPLGSGVSREAVTYTPSLSIFNSDRELYGQIRASLISWLGLSTELERRIILEMNNVSVATVNNLVGLAIEPGNHILYEAIKVGEIRLEIEEMQIAELRAKMRERFEDTDIRIDVNTSNNLTLMGTDIFVAYRVISLGSPQISTKKGRLKAGRDHRLGPYRMTFDVSRIRNCACDGQIHTTNLALIRHNNACLTQFPISVAAENYSGGTIGTAGHRVEFEYNLSNPNQPSITLGSRSRSGFIEVDVFNMNAYVDLKSCLFIEGYEFDSSSRTELTTVRYPVSSMRNPSASGW